MAKSPDAFGVCLLDLFRGEDTEDAEIGARVLADTLLRVKWALTKK